jgi:ABC-type multidrug transport system ATPase subunit
VEPILAIDGVTRRFGERVVLSGLSLTVEAGERVALRGPNGAGKTTLLRCIAGTLEATSGTISVAGHPAGSLEARRAIGLSLSQERSFYMRLSGAENLRLLAGVRGLSRRAARARVTDLVDELELAEVAAQRCDRCSTGQLQQLALARALLEEPALLLLDEPTRSLDSAARERFWAAVERRPSAAVLCATHLPEDLDRVSRHLSLEPEGPS